MDGFKTALTISDSHLAWWSFRASLAVAFGTIGLAAVTCFLAFETRRQAAETAASIKQAERHHEQSFMPYLRAVEGIDCLTKSTSEVNGNQVRAFQVNNANLSNRGLGVATNIRILARLDGIEYESISDSTEKRPAIPPLGPGGDSMTLSHFGIQIVTNVDSNTKLKNDEAALIIAYDDVFGRQYRTVYDGRAAVRFEGIERLEAGGDTNLWSALNKWIKTTFSA